MAGSVDSAAQMHEDIVKSFQTMLMKVGHAVTLRESFCHRHFPSDDHPLKVSLARPRHREHRIESQATEFEANFLCQVTDHLKLKGVADYDNLRSMILQRGHHVQIDRRRRRD